MESLCIHERARILECGHQFSLAGDTHSTSFTPPIYQGSKCPSQDVRSRGEITELGPALAFAPLAGIHLPSIHDR